MYDSKHRTTDGPYENRKDASGYSSGKREWISQVHDTNDDSSNHRKYIRTQSSSNNRTVPSTSSSQQQRQNGDKDRKSVKDSKKPLRVFGDWSEFKSSTGKTYFYNCRTEVSQWEKPKGWPSEEPSSRSSSSTTDRTKKESTNVHVSSTARSRHKVEGSSGKAHPNGDIHSQKSNHIHPDPLPSNDTSHRRLPSPIDDSSGMSFSSTSSKESTTVIKSDRNGNVSHTSSSETANTISDIPKKSSDKDPISHNGNGRKSSTNRSIPSSQTSTTTEQTSENDSSIPSTSKAERDQEIQRYYRADLIQHLTDWPSTQLEKQCFKLFDDYYGYNAKMSTAFIELKALKSNFRILEIKRSILTQRLLRCEQHRKEREDEKLL